MIQSATVLSRLNGAAPVEGIGLELHKAKNTIRCTWDFAVDGGAVGSILLKDDQGNAAILPNKAIITQVYTDTVTAVTTGAAGTLALTANASGDLKAALAAASWTGVQAGVPVGTAATMVKLTAQRQITAEIATGALTAGKVNFFIDYVLST